VTASWDLEEKRGAARLWDARTGQPLGEAMTHQGLVHYAEFSPDGARVVTASWDWNENRGAVRLWDVYPAATGDSELLAELAEAVAGGRLSDLGAFEQLDDQVGRLDGLRNKTANAPLGEPTVESFIRWFLSDPWSRTVSPLSSLTVPEYNQQQISADHPDVATSLYSVAEFYRDQGAYAKAEPLYQRSLAISEKALGPDHPEVAPSLNGLAKLYEAQRAYAKAEPLYQRSLAISEKSLGPDDPDVATILNDLAGLYDAQGAYAKAEPLYQRSLAIVEKALGKDHPIAKTIRDHLQAVQAYLKGQFQVQIKTILPDSQAEQVGIKPNDILLSYNNKPILSAAAFRYLRSLEPSTNGATELKVLRNGKELVFKIKPGKIGAELQEQVH